MLKEVSKYYIMNLPSREDRRKESIVELQKSGISNYEFVESVYWKEFSDEYLHTMTNLKYRHVTKDLIARYGLLGCGTSHLKAIKKFIDDFGTDGTKTCVILEDDFAIVNHSEIQDQIHAAINQSNDWDFIYLGGLKDPKNDKREEYLPNLDIAISVWNAHAYVIRNTQDIYDRMKALFDIGYFADRATRKLIRDDKHNKTRYLISYPYIITQRKSYSDINSRVK
jgi:GR25 family glycosyltransferase involved in LPS biosynthesis